MLVLQAKKKGLVMVNFFSAFLTCSSESTVRDVASEYGSNKKEESKEKLFFSSSD